MFEHQDALQNKPLFQALKRSEYFHPIYFSQLNTNQVTESFTGLRSGNLCFKHTVFFVTDSFPDHELIELILEQCSKDIYIEFRNLSSSNQEIPHFKRTEWYNIFVKTTNQIQIWQSLDESKKRQIKSSQQKGAEIIEAENENQVKEFYNILTKLYKSKIHKPLPDWNFFKAFYNETKGTEFGRFLLVKYKERIISGMLCPVSPGKEAYEWYIAGLDQEYKGTGIYPSVLATWAGIKNACDNNIPKFNFIGAGQPGKPYGVRDFKMQFGGELVNAGRYVKINKPFLYNLGKLYFKIREVI